MAKLTTHDVTQFWRVTTKKFVIRSKSVLISVEIMTVPRHLDIPAHSAGLARGSTVWVMRFAGVRIGPSWELDRLRPRNAKSASGRLTLHGSLSDCRIQRRHNRLFLESKIETWVELDARQ